MAKKCMGWVVFLLIAGMISAGLTAASSTDEYGNIIHDGTGTIDSAVENGQIVIGDKIFTLSSRAVFRSASGSPVTLSFFKKGMRVAYDLQEDAKRTIVALYEQR